MLPIMFGYLTMHACIVVVRIIGTPGNYEQMWLSNYLCNTFFGPTLY